MGSFANSLFKLMLGWLQTAVSAVWSAFTNENGNGLFNWIGKSWILIAGVLCAIGLAADLCVYVLRWKPFRRGKDTEAVPEKPAPVTVQTRPDVPETADEPVGEPDLSKWEVREQTETPAYAPPAEKPALVTNAGYVVPEDSPYRKPADREALSAAAAHNGSEPAGTASSGLQRGEPSPIMTGRRRRLNVSELFSDPEEDLRPFEAPQHVIDSRKAYHDPVYPRDWKKSEENRE